jgi:NADH-quinone oxidoreductase subunit J
MVLLVFVIMLLGAAGGEPPRIAARPRLALAGPLVALSLFAVLAAAIVRAPVPATATDVELPADHVAALADVLFVKFLFPFEIASVLLLAALIAAVVLAKRGERSWAATARSGSRRAP